MIKGKGKYVCEDKKIYFYFSNNYFCFDSIYYSVTILRAKRLNIWLGKYYAMITGDGWFTNTRSLGYVKGNRNSIDIFFKDTLPWDNLYQNGIDRYEKDELLITLSYVGSELHTSWHALRNAYPTLCDIEGEIEGIYFE